MPIGTAIGAVGGIIQQGIQGRQQRRNLADQHRYNKELAKYTYGQDLEMWNRMNQYNAPAQQMQRFKDAGLNPRLIYGKGSGGASAGQATQMPKYQQQGVDFMARQPMVNMQSIMQGVHGVQDLAIKGKQEELINQQTREVGNRADRQQLGTVMELLKYGNQLKPFQWKSGDKAIQRTIYPNLVKTELRKTQEQLQTEQQRQYQIRQSGRVSEKTADMFEIVKFGALALGAGSMLTGLGRLARLGTASKPIKGMAQKLLRQTKRISRSKSGRTRTINTRNFYNE